MFLVHFLYTKTCQGLQSACLASLWHALRRSDPHGFPPAYLESRKDQSNVVIFNWLPIDITVVDKNRHYSLKHALLHLTHLRDFLSYCLHTDVGRQLPFPSRSIDGALEIRKERGDTYDYWDHLQSH